MTPTPQGLGPALRRMRLVRGIKQSHLAEMLGVTQATVSRWERGTHRPSGAQHEAMLRLLEASPGSGRDVALRRLVRTSAASVHLVCDASHRLLAASPAREAEWGAPAAALLGRSMWRFASPEIEAAEARLADLGWYEPAAPAVAFPTRATDDAIVPIRPGRVLWERLSLEDGSAARLVTTLPLSAPLPEGARPA